MKQNLGLKSYKFLCLYFTCSILFLIFFIFSISSIIKEFNKLLLIIVFIFGGFFLTFFICFIIQLIRPKVIIEYDEVGIYLNYTRKKIVYIMFKDIESVIAVNAQGRGIQYKFGHLVIYTKNKKYRIGIISEVKDSEKYIHKRILYKYHRVF